MMRIYIGYDRREHQAYEVCKYSILNHSPQSEVIPLVQDYMRAQGLYVRDLDLLSSTDFSVTRYFVPHLNHYEGFAVYCDLDFLFTTDIDELMTFASLDSAVYVRKHEYTPKAINKMFRIKQTAYPRKNWASLMLFNCAHKDCKSLTPEILNSYSIPYLNEFKWTDKIGSLPAGWNFLVGEYEIPEPDALYLTDVTPDTPKAIHFTRGGLWLEEHDIQVYDALWNQYYSEMIK